MLPVLHVCHTVNKMAANAPKNTYVSIRIC